jgi:TetR/AcrR family transcriptional regulator, transcriptional repressor for nem operon
MNTNTTIPDNDDLKQRLIYTMFEALYYEGYHASNLNAILKKADTSKGGMYHYYKSKKELALQTITVAGNGFVEHFWKSELDKAINPIDSIELLCKKLPHTQLMNQAVFDFKYGCPINNLIQEMSAIDDDFATLLSSILKLWQKSIEEALQKAQNSNILRNDFDTYTMAGFIVASIEGALSSAKAHHDKKYYEDAIGVLLHFLNTLKKY